MTEEEVSHKPFEPGQRSWCLICGKAVFAWETAAFPVTGWEFERHGGGANQIKGRKRKEFEIAHAQCVDRKLRQDRQGHIPGQMEFS